MFDSRSPIVKIGGYIIIGFFTLIVIISFGVPDFMSRMGLDESTVASVNGEKIHILDYLRYRDRAAQRYKDLDSKLQQRYILYELIRYRLQIQKARELGISVSDDRVKKFIRSLPMFQDESGRFSNERLSTFMSHYRMALVEYYSLIKDVLIDEEMREMLKMGIGVSKDEIINDYAVEKSRIQIKYCHLASKDMINRFKDKISVSNKEIDDELKKNPGELKDPKTDKNRIRRKLEALKLEKIKRAFISEIDKLAYEGKSFETAAAKLGGNVKMSQEFQIGKPVKEMGAKGRPLYSLSNSRIFLDDCLAIDTGKTSRTISTIDGIYIFTPMVKIIKMEEPPQSEYKTIEKRLMDDKFNSVFISMMMKFREKSKIVESMKFDNKK